MDARISPLRCVVRTVTGRPTPQRLWPAQPKNMEPNKMLDDTSSVSTIVESRTRRINPENYKCGTKGGRAAAESTPCHVTLRFNFG
jgi:hypothetical protein